MTGSGSMTSSSTGRSSGRRGLRDLTDLRREGFAVSISSSEASSSASEASGFDSLRLPFGLPFGSQLRYAPVPGPSPSRSPKRSSWLGSSFSLLDP